MPLTGLTTRPHNPHVALGNPPRVVAEQEPLTSTISREPEHLPTLEEEVRQ